MNPRLAEIPDDVLQRGRGRNANDAARRLEKWLVHRDLRPTFLELDQERRRRGMQ